MTTTTISQINANDEVSTKYSLAALRQQMDTVAEAVEDELVNKGNSNVAKENTSRTVATLAAIQYLGRWDSKTVSQIADERSPNLRTTNTFKVRLSEARRVLKVYGKRNVGDSKMTLAKHWANGTFSEGITLGVMMKKFRKQVSMVERITKAVSKLQSADLLTVREVIEALLQGRQADTSGSNDDALPIAA